MVVWLILTMPRSPNRACSSISSRPSNSGSYTKSLRNQPSFHRAKGVGQRWCARQIRAVRGQKASGGRTASVDASGTGPCPRGLGTPHPAPHRQKKEPPRSVLGFGVSCGTLLAAQVAVELAEQGVPVLLGPIGQVRDEVLDLLPRGFAQGLGPAEANCS